MTSVADILRKKKTWVRGSDLAKLVANEFDVTVRIAYTKMKQSVDSGDIIKKTREKHTHYGLFEWNPELLDEKKRIIVKTVLKDLRELFGYPFPPMKRIASHPVIHLSPSDLAEILLSLKWREPSKEEEKEFEGTFKSIGEWAWQYKYERDKLWLPHDETARRKFEKRITRFLEIYPLEVRNPHERGV